MRLVVTGGSGFIGTNLVERFLHKGWKVLNIDIAEPKISSHLEYWKRIDLLDRKAIIDTFTTYKPNVVLHFGARTDLDETRNLKGYAANIDGVANIIEAVQHAKSIDLTVFASSRLVSAIDYKPKSDVDYKPSTLYGESKVRGEKLVRQAAKSLGDWVIVRPTSIWGPWFHVPYKQFFIQIAKGQYVHPGRYNPRKSYGYVGNTVYQIERIIEAPVERVNGRTLYLCDYEPLYLREWANQIQRALGTKPIRTAPFPFLRFAAEVGEVAKRAGWRHPPLTRFRLNNLITEMVYDTSELQSIVGPLPFSTEQGVVTTVEWLRTFDK
jgi:nucleoside-diphosphate-sugar epimerase